jgi:hypothetical protein
VRPEIRLTPSDSGSSTIRTGIRCASRTQEKVGLTLASRFEPALRLGAVPERGVGEAATVDPPQAARALHAAHRAHEASDEG